MSRQKAAVWIAGALAAIVLIAGAANWRKISLILLSPRTLRIKAQIDGVDTIKIQGSTLWYEHHEYAPPSGATSINGMAWTPTWNGAVSEPFRQVYPPLPRSEDLSIRLTKLAGRGPVVIAEKPRRENDFILSILLDDRAPFGADLYEILIQW